MTSTACIDTPLGEVVASVEDGKLCSIRIAAGKETKAADESPLSKQLRAELKAYFTAKNFSFTVPFVMHGTAFQQRVWRALQEIPVGETTTYGQLAKRLHSSARAVGGACRANPLPIIVPCHRVIAKQGIGGYDGKTAGKRLDIKRWLLRHEGVAIDG